MDQSNEIYEAYGFVDKLTKYIERLEQALTALGHAELLKNIRDEFNREDPSCQESESTDENEKNPMLIQNIVEVICQYLSFKMLQISRLVHPSWDKAIMTPKRLQNTKLVMKFTNSKTDYNSTLKRLFAAYPIEITASDHEPSSPPSLPVPRTLLISNFGTEENQKELVKWFRIYGRCITSLELGSRDSDFSLVSSDRLFQFISEMPRIEELKILEFDFQGPLHQNDGLEPLLNLQSLEIGRGKEIKGSPEDIKTLLRLAKNLKTLKLWVKPSQGMEGAKGQQEHFLQICHQHGYLVNLTNLDLSKTRLTYPALKLLESAKFTKLKSFAFGSIKEIHGQAQIPEESVFEAFSNLFRTLQPTLEYLNFNSATFILKSLPPEMKVEVLTIQDFWILEQESGDMRAVHFLSKFSNLKSLVLSSPSTMHIRYLPSVFLPLNPQLLIGKIFPTDFLFQINSLSKLELINTPLIEKEPFQRLIGSFPALQVLTLTSDSYDEGDLIWDLASFLTELSFSNQLQELNLQFDYRFGLDMAEAEVEFNDAIAQQFSKLVALRKCTFRCKKRKIKIKENAVVKGFTKAPSLTYLALHNFTIEPEIQSLFNSVRGETKFGGCLSATNEI